MKLSPATEGVESHNWRIIRTEDGSDTLFSEKYQQHYHSRFGALTESRHLFLEAGFRGFSDAFAANNPFRGPVSVLEIGFGTGLNALLTLIESGRNNVSVSYTALEPEPVPENVWRQLNYPCILGSVDYSSIFARLHQSGRGSQEHVTGHFRLCVLTEGLGTFRPSPGSYHIIYFDAFDSAAQPELWHEEQFKILYDSLLPGGLLATYSVKGAVVRAMKAAGFRVEKLPGPPGKRHILTAFRI